MDDPMDDEARKLAADQSAEAIREAYAREQAAAAANAAPAPDDDDKAAPLVQGVDDEWADWRGCVCGGSYYGDMVACEGGCDNWFHFACVGLTRLPRGEWLCQDCKTKPKKRRVEKQPEPLPPPPAEATAGDEASPTGSSPARTASWRALDLRGKQPRDVTRSAFEGRAAQARTSDASRPSAAGLDASPRRAATTRSQDR